MYSQFTFDFLTDLAKNNNREWFHSQKKRYETIKKEHELIVGKLIEEIGEFEDLTGVQVKDSSYRINRDVRFSSDKSPYKTWLASSYGKGGKKSIHHDYYLHIQPNGQSGIAGGMYAPTSEQLAKFRQEVDYNPQEFKDIILNPTFVANFGYLKGTELKSMPKGYPKDHPEIAILRKTQCYVWHSFTDAEVMSANFTQKVSEICRVMKPFLDWLNQVINE